MMTVGRPGGEQESSSFGLNSARSQVHGELSIDSRLEVCLDVQPLLCSDMNVG